MKGSIMPRRVIPNHIWCLHKQSRSLEAKKLTLKLKFLQWVGRLQKQTHCAVWKLCCGRSKHDTDDDDQGRENQHFLPYVEHMHQQISFTWSSITSFSVDTNCTICNHFL